MTEKLVSHAGSFKQVSGEWVSQGGAWVEVAGAAEGPPQQTITTFIISKGFANVGDTITLSASVNTLSPVPVGSVQFLLDGAPYSEPVPVDANGGAISSYAVTATGTFTFNAQYLGSGIFLPSLGDSKVMTATSMTVVSSEWSMYQFGGGHALAHSPGGWPALSKWGSSWSGDVLTVNVPPGEALFPGLSGAVGYVLDYLWWPPSPGALPVATYPDSTGLLRSHNYGWSGLAGIGGINTSFGYYNTSTYTNVITPHTNKWSAVLPGTGTGPVWQRTDYVDDFLTGAGPPAVGSAIPASHFLIDIFTMGMSNACTFTIRTAQETSAYVYEAALAATDEGPSKAELKRHQREMRETAKPLVKMILTEYDNVDPLTQVRMNQLRVALQKRGLMEAA